MPYKDKEEARRYQREYAKRNSKSLLEKKRARRIEQREFIDAAKSKPCADCGVQYDPWIMDFDHVRGEKRVNLADMAKRSYSWASIREEIEKCDVVCANCHRQRTHVRA